MTLDEIMALLKASSGQQPAQTLQVPTLDDIMASLEAQQQPVADPASDSLLDHFKAGLVQAGSGLRYGLPRGLAQHVASSYNPERDLPIFAPIAEGAQEFADYLAGRQRQMTDVQRSIAQAPDTTIERAVEAAPDTIRRFAPWLAGGPLVGAPLSYAESYAQKMNEAKDRGADMDKALLTSAPAALVETLIEGGLGPEAAATRVATGGVLKNLGKTILRSGAEEGLVEEPLQTATDYAARGLQGEFAGMPLGDVLYREVPTQTGETMAQGLIPEAWEQAKVGALLGGALGGGTFAAQASVNAALDVVQQRDMKENPWKYGVVRDDLPFDSTRFYTGIQGFLDTEKATATMEQLTARAASAGENVDDYVAKRISGIVLGGTPPEDALFQLAADAAPGPMWYSRLSNIVEEKIGKSTSKEQLIATLRNNQVNEEELKYSGLLDLPDGALLTKDQVRQVLDDEAARVEVKMLGTDQPGWWVVRDSAGNVVFESPGTPSEKGESEAMAYARSIGGGVAVSFVPDNDARPAKYADRDELWTPGGKNRREILITIPRRGTMANVPGVTQQHYGDVDPNTIAHSRVQDFTLEDGTKVLEVTEVQSDPHQKARDLREAEILRIATERGVKRTDKEGLSKIAEEVPKEFGYRDDSAVKSVSSRLAEAGDIFRKLAAAQVGTDPSGVWFRLDPNNTIERGVFSSVTSAQPVVASMEVSDALDNLIEAERAFDEASKRRDRGIPDIPFKRNWEELVAKHILRYAAENGYDMVAWTTGEEQVKRYSDAVRQSVDEIKWAENGRVIGMKDGEEAISIRHQDGVIVDGPSVADSRRDPRGKSLSEVFGKALAEKIMSSPSGSLSGEGLTVGGEGFKAAYDVRLPSIFKKISKAAVEMVELPGGVKSHSLRISPDLRRQQLLKGNAKWQRGKAAVVFGEDGRAIIYAFAGADVSSVAHELAHIFERDLDPEQRSVIRAEYGDGVKASESFARGFERYLATGKAPTPRLRDVFSKYKIWMSEIYGKIEDSDIDVPISGRVRSVFDSLLIHRPDTKGRIIHTFEEAAYVLSRLARLSDTSDPDEADRTANERALLALGVNPLGAGDEFDVLDARRLAYEKENAALPRTLADAISDFRNAVAFGARKVEDSLEASYQKLHKLNRLPKTGKGKQISFEEYSELKKEKTRKEIEQALAKATENVGPEAPTSERIKAMDAATAAILKKRRIKPTEVGYRGELYPIDGKTHQQVLAWLETNNVKGADPKRLLELADMAPEEIKMPVALLLSGEARRRASKEFVESPLLSEPARVIQDALAEINQDLNAKLLGRVDFNLPGPLEKIRGWLRHEFSTNALGLQRHLRGLPSSQREQLVRLGEALNSAGERMKARLIYKANVYAADADAVVNEFLDRSRMSGGPVMTKNEVFEKMGEAYESGQYDKVGDEALATFLRERTAPLMNEVSSIIGTTITDSKLKVTIRENFGSYLFRRYAFFDSKENYWASFDRTQPAYQRIFDRIKKKKYNEIADQFKKLYGSGAETLLGNIEHSNALIEEFVNARVHGEVNKILFAHAEVPGATPAVKNRLARPDEEFLLPRELKDPDVRELLGQKKQLDFAVHNFITTTASDLHHAVVRSGMAQMFQKMGLLRTKEEGAAERISDKLNATKMTQFDEARDGLSDFYYAHPVVKAFYSGLDDDVRLSNKVVSAAIGLHKSALVISPGNYLSQVLSWAQGAMVASGMVRHLAFFRPNNLKSNWRLAKELTKPGSVKEKSVAEALKAIGLEASDVQGAVDELIKFGLDEAGEYAHDIRAETEALVEVTKALKAESRTKRALEKASAVTSAAHEFFRRPDVMVKVFAYQQNISELMDIEGLANPDQTKVEVPEWIKREAAHMALMTTQSPSTTPNIVKRIAGRNPKSTLGAAFALANYGFQTFVYQSAKLHTAGMYYGLRHISRALDPSLANDPRKQAKYLSYGIGRTVGALVSSYGLWEVMRAAFFDDDDESADAVKRSLFDDQRFGRVFGGIPAFLNFGEEVPMISREDGRIQINVTDFGQVDLSETFHRSLGLLAKAGYEAYEEITGNSETPGQARETLNNAIQQVMGMALAPSPGLQMTGELLGVSFQDQSNAPLADRYIPRFRNNHPLNSHADSLNTETPFALTAPFTSLITNEGLSKASTDAAGTMPKAAYNMGKGALQALGVIDEEVDARGSRILNPGGRAFYRHTTSIAPQRLDAAGMFNGAMSAEWNKDAHVLDGYKKRWRVAREAGNFAEQAQILAEGEETWNRMAGRVSRKLGEMSTRLSQLEIDWVVNDKKVKTNVVPYKEVIVPILYENRIPTFGEYLDSLR